MSFFEVEEAFSLRRIATGSAFYYHIPDAALREDIPIVAAGPNEFMDIRYYGDHNLTSRAVYVSSEEFANQYLGFTFLERMMLGAAPYFFDDFFLVQMPGAAASGEKGAG